MGQLKKITKMSRVSTVFRNQGFACTYIVMSLPNENVISLCTFISQVYSSKWYVSVQLYYFCMKFLRILNVCNEDTECFSLLSA